MQDLTKAWRLLGSPMTVAQSALMTTSCTYLSAYWKAPAFSFQWLGKRAVKAPKRVVHRIGRADRKDKVYPLEKSTPFTARGVAVQKFTYSDLNSYWSSINSQVCLRDQMRPLETFYASFYICDPLDSGHQECPSMHQTPDHYTYKSAWAASREHLQM